MLYNDDSEEMLKVSCWFRGILQAYYNVNFTLINCYTTTYIITKMRKLDELLSDKCLIVIQSY